MTKENSQKMDNCVQYYCVYWYPTIFHKRRKSKTHQIPEKFIDDGSPLYSLSISVSEDEASGDLRFTLRFYDGKVSKESKPVNASKEKEIEVTYKACQTSPHDCFVTYSYHREKFVADVKVVLGYFYNKANNQAETASAIIVSDEKANEFVDRIFLNFYHQAKGLYHEHEVQKESDGRLHAYFFNEREKSYVQHEPNIDLRNHEAIICYLDQYEQLFSTYAQQVSTLYKQFKNHVNSYSKVIRPEDLDKATKDVLVESLLKLRFEKYLKDKVDEPAAEDCFDAPLSAQDIKILKDEDEDEENKKKQWITKNQKEIAQNTNEVIISEIQQRYNDITVSLVSELNTMLKLCGDALTEYNYCKTLLESRYNSDYGYGILFDSCGEIHTNIQDIQPNTKEVQNSFVETQDLSEIKDLRIVHRKKAFNIDNSVRYIEEIRHKGDVWENQLVQDSVIRINHLSNLNQNLLEKIQALTITNKGLLDEAKKSDCRAMWVSIAFGVVGVASLIASIVSICRCI